MSSTEPRITAMRAAPVAPREATVQAASQRAASGRVSTRKPAAKRRVELIAAAEAIARADGLAAITMRAVAAMAGVAPTLVIHHVESMDHLVAETFERIVAAELAEITRFAESVANSGARLEAVLDTVLDDRAPAETGPENTGPGSTRDEVTLVWVEAWALGRRNALLAAAVREQMDAWRAFFAALVQAGCDAGRYRVADPLAVAGQLLGMVDGLNAHSLVGWGGGVDRRSLMRRAAGAMLGVAES